MTAEQIRIGAEAREITRLCHFTPLRNLVHIATSDAGLYSTAQLTAPGGRSTSTHRIWSG